MVDKQNRQRNAHHYKLIIIIVWPTNAGPVVDDFSSKPFMPIPPLEAMMEGKFNRVPFIRFIWKVEGKKIILESFWRPIFSNHFWDLFSSSSGTVEHDGALFVPFAKPLLKVVLIVAWHLLMSNGLPFPDGQTSNRLIGVGGVRHSLLNSFQTW